MAQSVVLPDGLQAKSLVAEAVAAHPNSPKAVDLANAIQDITLETQILGASLLTIPVIDPDWKLASYTCFCPDSDGLLPAVDIEFPAGSGWWWRLCMVKITLDRTQATLTLTFQDRVVGYLREHWGPMGVRAGTATRAEFIKQIVNQVGRGSYASTEQPITFVSPSLTAVQPVASSLTNDLGQITVSTAEQVANATTKAHKDKGVGQGAAIAVQGNRSLSTQQLQNISAACSLANQAKAGKLATLALLCACIQESSFENLNSGSGTSKGVLQFKTSTAEALGISQTDVTGCINAFLNRGYYFGGVDGATVNYGPGNVGGAITVARLNPNLSPGQVAQAVQGSQFTDGSKYTQWVQEAEAIYAAGGLASGSLDAIESVTSDVSQLTRGTSQNPDEDSWDCIQRLAQQVSWYAFTYGNTLFYMTGEDLIGQQPVLYLDRLKDRAQIATLTGTWDNTAFLYQSTHKKKGKVQRKSRISRPQTPSSIQLSLVCKITDYRAGDVIVFQNAGPMNGRWVIADATRNCLTDTFTQFTLAPPLAPYPEPQLTSTGTTPSTGSPTNPGNAPATTGQTAFADPGLAAMGAVAAVLDHPNAAIYVGAEIRPIPVQGGLFGPAPIRTDCSGFAILCYQAAGYPDPSGNNYNGAGDTASLLANSTKVASPISGDLCLFGPAPKPVHVTVYVGNGQAVGMNPAPPHLGSATAGPAVFLGYYRPNNVPGFNSSGILQPSNPFAPITSPGASPLS